MKSIYYGELIYIILNQRAYITHITNINNQKSFITLIHVILLTDPIFIIRLSIFHIVIELLNCRLFHFLKNPISEKLTLAALSLMAKKFSEVLLQKFVKRADWNKKANTFINRTKIEHYQKT